MLCVQTYQPLIAILHFVILCIIIGDVHQFIGHCIIPLDPWTCRMYVCLSIQGTRNIIYKQGSEASRKRSIKTHWSSIAMLGTGHN